MAARKTRMAISPRLAAINFLKVGMAAADAALGAVCLLGTGVDFLLRLINRGGLYARRWTEANERKKRYRKKGEGFSQKETKGTKEQEDFSEGTKEMKGDYLFAPERIIREMPSTSFSS